MVRAEIMIVAGIGFRTHATCGDIVSIVHRAQVESGTVVQLLAVPNRKAQHEALLDAVAKLSLPLTTIDETRLERVQDRCPTKSAAAMSAVGLASVAEACALAALGEQAQLLLPRIKSARATCAIATGDQP
jgi:cobalt-precorrin 5A hydrolase